MPRVMSLEESLAALARSRPTGSAGGALNPRPPRPWSDYRPSELYEIYTRNPALYAEYEAAMRPADMPAAKPLYVVDLTPAPSLWDRLREEGEV